MVTLTILIAEARVRLPRACFFRFGTGWTLVILSMNIIRFIVQLNDLLGIYQIYLAIK